MSIYKAQNSTDHISREMEEIYNRRSRLEERTVRILDPKERQFGIDVQTLNKQVQERAAREQMEMDRGNFYDDQSNRFAATATEMESMRTLEIRERAGELNDFRHQQIKEKRRRDLVTKANADNYYDMDTQFLKFPGEDRGKPTRDKEQQQMQQEWLAQQVQMLRDRDEFERAEADNYEAQQNQMNAVRVDVESEAAYQRKQRNLEQVAYNKLLAKEKTDKEHKLLQEDQALNHWEIRNHLNSKLLNEGVGDSDGPSHFKGFTTAQRQRILDEQAVQIAGLRQKRDQEAAFASAYDVSVEQVRQAVVDMDVAHRSDQHDNRKTLQREQQVQAREKSLRYDYLDTVVYTNPVKESYFGQFGQGSR